MNQPKKTIMLWGAAAAAVAVALCFPSPSSGQAAAVAAVEDPAIAQLVAEVAEQHNKIVANQQAIEVKVNGITETLRLARIFVSRGGGKK